MMIVGIILGAIAAVIAAALVRGWALTVLWGWFLVPYGLPTIGIATAIGISLIVGMFTAHLEQRQAKETKSGTDAVVTVAAHAFGAPLLVLAIGWIVKSFM